MHCRMTLDDEATGLHHDVVLECDAATPVREALAALAAGLPLRGTPTVGGRPLDLDAPVASSALRHGAHLRYGDPGADDDPLTATPGRRTLLTVVSGPDTGRSVGLEPGRLVVVGRATDAGLALTDGDVSRRHARIGLQDDRVEVRDEGSANGTYVDGDRLTATPTRIDDAAVIQVGGTRLVVERPAVLRAVLTRAPDGGYLLNRRFPDRRAAPAPDPVVLPTPLAEDEHRGLPLLAMLLPLVVAVAMAAFLRSPVYLAFGLLSPLMLGGNWWTERRRRKARDLRKEGTYQHQVEAARARVEAAVDEEDADVRRRSPEPTSVARTVLELRRDLWIRQPGEDGWLDLRLGVADRPAAIEVRGERPPGWADPVLRAAPAVVGLEDVGVVGLAGPAAWARARLTWLVAQAAVLHSPDELRLAVFAPDATEDDLGWLRWLPHLVSDDGFVRCAWDLAAVDELAKALGSEVDRITGTLPGGQRPVGHTVVVLVGAGALVRRPQVADLLARGIAAGLRFVCTDTDERLLPDACRAVCVARGTGAVLAIDQGASRAITVDELAPGVVERMARTLAPIRRIGDAPASALPGSVRFLDVTALDGVDALRATWRLRPESTEVVLGRDRDGLFALDLARQGPHAVVAGTSGAGKSEFLQTWVAALALANTPERLSIVLVDFKGGSSLGTLRRLPHVLGTATNLDARLADRALSSLRAELTRRQEQLAAAGAADRDDYLRRAATAPLPPFPRLLVVVDELAEVRERFPTLAEGLQETARIGRSLGVHLLLATQRPAGVVDAQIRANVALRVCLRTLDEAESRDVVGVPDAARISDRTPGRALVLRGGAPATVQSARVTTPVEAGSGGDAPRAVLQPWDAVAPPPAPPGEDGLRTDAHELVDRVRAAADAEGLAAPYPMWTDPLPEVVVLDDLAPRRHALTVGRRDVPSQQRQDDLALPLGSGHLAIIGSGRTGRTSALRGIAAALSRDHAPTEVHVHAVDGGGALSGLTALPHVGVVAHADDGERVERLLARLVAVVGDRRRRLTARSAASVDELDEELPRIVLLVDDWSGVLDMDTPASTALADLMGGPANAAGITVVLAGDERLLRGRILQRLTHRLCLRLNEPGEATALGLSVRTLPDDLPPGRALWTADGSEVQLPLLAPGVTGREQAEALTALAGKLHAAHGDPLGPLAPLRLDPLPEEITREEAELLPDDGSGLLLGVGGDRLSQVRLPTTVGTATVVAGPAGSGRTTALVGLAVSAVHEGSRAVLVAARPGPLHERAAAAGVVVVAPAELAAEVTETPAVVLIDDADSVDLEAPVVEQVLAASALVVGARLEAFSLPRGIIRTADSRRRATVLLGPASRMNARDHGIEVDGHSGPPGRALVRVGHETRVVQVLGLSGT